MRCVIDFDGFVAEMDGCGQQLRGLQSTLESSRLGSLEEAINDTDAASEDDDNATEKRIKVRAMNAVSCCSLHACDQCNPNAAFFEK